MFGNIKGGLHHRLIDPLYSFERILLENPENGLQMQYQTPRLFLDTWLHWVTLLNEKDTIPEEIVGGLSLYYDLIHNNYFTFQLPIQGMVYHSGGQGLGLCVYNLYCGAIGSRLQLPINQNFVQHITLENYYLVNQYSGPIARVFKKGEAFYTTVMLQTKWLTFMGSYWQGIGFSSENLGGLLYQSIALKDNKVIHSEKARELCFLRLGRDWPLAPAFTLSFRFEPYYDLRNDLFEHAVGFYLHYCPYFPLKKGKPASYT